MTYYAQDRLGRKALKGKILAANAQLWVGSRLVKAEDIDPQFFPFQINNMSEWLRRASHQLRSDELNARLRGRPLSVLENPEVMIVNDGKGIKEGRGRNEASFTYILGDDVKLEIRFVVKQHAQIYMEKVKRGEKVVPPPEARHPGGRPKNQENPYYDPDKNMWVVKLPSGDVHDPWDFMYFGDEQRARDEHAALVKSGMFD